MNRHASGLAARLALLIWVAACGGADLDDSGGAADTEAAASTGVRAASTVRMAELLDSVARDAEARGLEFANAARVRQLRNEVIPPDLPSQSGFRLALAEELIRSGDTREAADTLLALHAVLAGQPQVPEEFSLYLEELLGLAHLRIAEQENCVMDRETGMCLFPISLEAAYRKQEGSLEAIEWYTRRLERFPDDMVSRWLLNVAYMTVGRHPAGVPERWRMPLDAFASDARQVEFPEIAASVGVATLGLSGGAVSEDFDGDGDLDLFATSWGIRDQVRFFENRGTEGFADRTMDAGLEGIVGGLNAQPTDFDGDGAIDVFVLRGAWSPIGMPNSLLRNRGDGTFEDVTAAAGLLDFRSSQTAAWADFDGDGTLDVYVGNESTAGRYDPAQLFLNTGSGTFEERAMESGADVVGLIKAVTAGDYDDDGDPDLYVSRLDQPNVLLRNDGVSDGRLRFTDVTDAAGVAEPLASFPAWFFDYDEDGDEDLFVSGYDSTVGHLAADYLGMEHEGTLPRLYRNRGDGTFEDVAVAAGMGHPYLTMGSNYGDMNGDGWLDVYLATGDPDFRSIMPNRMLRGDGRGGFLDVTTEGGFGHLQKGHGVAFADLDNDGDQDVFTVMGGAYEGDVFHDALFANPGSVENWVALRLEGRTANRAAVGARVRLTVRGPEGERTIHRTVGQGSSFGGNPFEVQIGMGSATEIVSLEVDWPAPGGSDRWTSVTPGSKWRIVEAGEPAVLDVARWDILEVARSGVAAQDHVMADDHDMGGGRP